MSKTNEDFINNIINVLSDELHDKELEIAKEHIENEFAREDFTEELNSYSDRLTKGNFIRDKLICTCILLGLGRNRTIKVMNDKGVNRTTFERVRDLVKINDSSTKIENEKNITRLKIQSTKRDRRIKSLKDSNWEKIKEEYLNGESIVNLSKKSKLTVHLIGEQLKDEGLFDESRSTIIRSRIAKKKINEINDDFIVKLVEENPLDSKYLWWEKSKEKYPWMLRGDFFKKLDDLGLTRTEDEINEIRRMKSKTMANRDYAVKVNSYRAIREVFNSTDELVEKFMSNEIGSYSKIADKVNKEISFDFKISPRQVERIITGHPSYEPRKSAGQKQLFNFIKKSFRGLEVLEEYRYTKSNRRIDVYIPSLNIGIEFNGDYWHSDSVIKHNYNKTAYEFHRDRVQDLKKLGVRLVYVWEDDWNNNYEEVESSLSQMKWDSEILNKYESEVNLDSKPPSLLPGKLRCQIVKFLNDNDVSHVEEDNSSFIEIPQHNIVIDVPNYNSLSERKRSLNLQKNHEKEGVELITFLPWRNFVKIKDFLSYRLKLKNINRVAARNCEVVINDGITSEQREFFDRNHLLGYNNNFRHIEKTVSLTYKGKLVISALFVRKPNSETVELKRLVSDYEVAVQGGASRVLKHYMRSAENVSEIFTFSDCDLGFGMVYKTLGFKQIERSREQLTWFNEKENMTISNLSLIMVGADRLLKNFPNYSHVGIGENLPSNQEIVQSYGFVPIYDSGYKKWTMEI